MSPSPMSPISKTSAPIRTASQDSADSVRKRVCKACDRCRLKKSKCDGSSPCSRCRADNAICIFGERKKSHDKVYPKGYVEMLEQQQGQLVTALQETYRRLLAANAWNGPVLSETNGYPLTHDILKALNLLETKQDGSGELETFEEDFSKIQSKLLSEGASYTHRRGSFGSDSDNSQHAPLKHSSTSSVADTKHPHFRNSFTFSRDSNAFNSNTSSPLAQSPVPQTRAAASHASSRPSSFHQPPPLTSDPQFYQAQWTISDMSSSRGDNPNTMMRPKFDMPASDVQSSHSELEGFITNNDNFSGLQGSEYDADMTSMQLNGYPQAFPTAFTNSATDFNSLLDPMEIEFSRFVSVAT